MTLGFSTQINGKPNCFPEKILSGMLKNLENGGDNDLLEVPEYIYRYGEKAGYASADTVLQVIDNSIPKLHTMREDSHDRWKPGMDIHMVINNRTKNRFQFAPVVKCVSRQEVIITEKIMTTYDCIKLKDGRVFTIQVDGKYLPLYRIHELAINDGFDSVEDFFTYFNKDCKLKLIHWTDLKY